MELMQCVEATEEELREALQEAGTVEGVRIVRDKVSCPAFNARVR